MLLNDVIGASYDKNTNWKQYISLPETQFRWLVYVHSHYELDMFNGTQSLYSYTKPCIFSFKELHELLELIV